MELPAAAVVVALLTPFADDEELDLDALRAHVELLMEEGVDGLMTCGTTGEGALLEPDEIVRVTEAVVRATGGRVRVIAHVGRPSTRSTVALARQALAAGADAVSAVTPYYHAPDADGLRRHYAALVVAAADAGAPAFAYAIPTSTGVHVAPALVAQLAADGVAGLKDSTRSLETHRAYLEAAAGTPGFALLVGGATLQRDALAAGAAGAVLALANLRPELPLAVARAHRAGDTEAAGAAQRALDAVDAELAARGATIPVLKAGVAEVLAARGEHYPARVRGPLGALPVASAG